MDDSEEVEPLATLEDRGRPRQSDHDHASDPRPNESEDGDSVLALPTIYAKAELGAEHIPQAGGGGTVGDKRRRVLHFIRPRKCRTGRWKFAGVVVMIPGRRLWIAHTIDDATRTFDCWECFGPTIDPFHALEQIKQKVIDLEVDEATAGGIVRMWQNWRGHRITTSTSLAKVLCCLDIPRAKKPEDLRDWLLENVPRGRKTSAARAVRAGVRAQLRDLAAQV